jgi:PAS domain S-box-containing protein
MQKQKIIELLGYSPKEVKVYLASLEMGESHLSNIAVKVKMPRSTVQVIFDRLQEDGLMSCYEMLRHKYWVAARPEVFLEKLKNREQAIANALPELIAIRNESRKHLCPTDESVKESLVVFKLFSVTIIMPILISNSDSEIVYVNDKWQSEHGYTLEEVIGENPRFLRSELTLHREFEALAKALKEDWLFESEQIVNRRKDGALLNMITAVFSVHHGQRTYLYKFSIHCQRINYPQILRIVIPISRICFSQ